MVLETACWTLFVRDNGLVELYTTNGTHAILHVDGVEATVEGSNGAIFVTNLTRRRFQKDEANVAATIPFIVDTDIHEHHNRQAVAQHVETKYWRIWIGS